MDSVDISIWTSFLRVAVVLLLMAPLVYFTTRWYGRKHVGHGNIRILETMNLGPGKALYIIQWRQNQLLLGVTGQTIQVLAHEECPQQFESLSADTNEGEGLS